MEFQIYAGGYEDIAERVQEGRADLGFLTSVVRSPQLSFHALRRDQMMAILPRDHPLAARQRVSVGQVAREELVMPLRGSEQDIRAALADSPSPLNVRYALNDDFSALAMVEHGFGVSVMPELILRNSAFDVEVRPFSPARWRTIGIATLDPAGLTAVARTFVSFLTNPDNADLLQ